MPCLRIPSVKIPEICLSALWSFDICRMVACVHHKTIKKYSYEGLQSFIQRNTLKTMNLTLTDTGLVLLQFLCEPLQARYGENKHLVLENLRKLSPPLDLIEQIAESRELPLLCHTFRTTSHCLLLAPVGAVRNWDVS